MIDYSGEYDYASTRLDHTFVLHEGKLVYIQHVEGNGNAFLCDVDGNEFVVPVTDLDVSPPQLGYVNYNGSIYYVIRKPMRRDWRQGMRENNLVEMLYGEDIPIWSLQPTISNDYPTVEEVLESGCGAFSRDWAIKNDRLYYRTNRVGSIGKGKGIKLMEKFRHLIESLSEAIA